MNQKPKTAADPLPSERKWYRSSQTGDRGYIVRREGRDMIKLDRPGEILRALDASWTVDQDTKPLRAMDLARVAHAADRELCRAMALQNAPKEWVNLTDTERISWLNVGPGTTNATRIALYKAIAGVLHGLTK